MSGIWLPGSNNNNGNPASIWKPGDPLPTNKQGKVLDRLGRPKIRPEDYTGGRGTMTLKQRLANRTIANSDMATGQSAFEKAATYLITSYFGGGSKWQVIREGRLYRPSKVKEVRDQLTGMAPEVAEVKWQGKWVCDIQSNWPPNHIIRVVSEAFSKVKFKV